MRGAVARATGNDGRRHIALVRQYRTLQAGRRQKMTEDTQATRLKNTVASNESHRSRARSVATLLAASAGALAAGLVIAPTMTLPEFARIAGLVTVVLLVLATSMFVIASVTSLGDNKTRKDGSDRRGWLPWRLVIPGSDESPAGLIAQATSLSDRIRRNTDIGMGIAGVAVAALILTLVSATVLRTPPVTLEVSRVPTSVPLCPHLPTNFSGSAERSDISSASPFLRIRVNAGVCSDDLGSTVVLVRWDDVVSIRESHE